MSFFESLLALLFAAILLLQVSRRLSIPYPAMLAAAGVVIALIPGSPEIRLDPETALALFIAPALVDAAYDFPVGAVWRLWRPLFALAVVAVLLTAGTVAWLGVAVAGLPFYAALALGAVVAPPDAAAATAVLGAVSLPRGSVAVLKGESLLNDATALLLFGLAISLQSHGGIDGGIALRLGVAAPGGIALGILFARLSGRLARFVSNSLGGNLLEFVSTFAAWIVAERLGLSPVLCLVAFAMTIARAAGPVRAPRMRVHSFAVWDSVVFLLNVLAFLLMGLQARTIVGAMSPARFHEALGFAALVIAAVILVRLVWVMVYNRLAARFRAVRGDYPAPGLARGLLVGWCGMRGLVTLATAFALPLAFPQRDLIVLTAFGVVLATLVLQGLTLVPLVRLLGLDGDGELAEELGRARMALADVGLATLDGAEGPVADYLRFGHRLARAAAEGRDEEGHSAKRRLGVAAIRAQRARLDAMRNAGEVGGEAYLILQEELDFRELAMATEEERHIVES